MRFLGRGHGAIRATHAKTFELSIDAGITERATCVIAVDARPLPAEPLAGPVRIEISAGGETFVLRALANSSWDPAGPVVIRRSPLRLPGTFATDATAASSDLPRSLVAALQAPDAVVEVVVEPEPSPSRTVVLYAVDPSHPVDARMRAELDAADTVLAEDADARRLVGSRAVAGRRTLVVATRDLPGRTILDRLRDAAVETVGMPAPFAVAAACPSRAPLVLGSDADPRALVRGTPSTHRLVVTVERDKLAALLQLAERERGTGLATVAQEFVAPVRAMPGELPDLPSRDPVHCCLHPAVGRDAIDPLARAVIAGLLADGVPTRTAAQALATLTGWDRRRAYAAIVDWAT